MALFIHPTAAMMFREIVNAFEKGLPPMVPQVADWITMKVYFFSCLFPSSLIVAA